MSGWALVQTLKVVGGGVAGVSTMIAARIFGQIDSLTDSLPEIVGGSAAIVVAALSIRWVLTVSKTVEEKWLNEINRLERRVEDQDQDIKALAIEKAQWESKYWNLWAEHHGEGRKV